jgi:hypothetical protein
MLFEHLLQVGERDHIREGVIVVILDGAARVEVLEARGHDHRPRLDGLRGAARLDLHLEVARLPFDGLDLGVVDHLHMAAACDGGGEFRHRFGCIPPMMG